MVYQTAAFSMTLNDLSLDFKVTGLLLISSTYCAQLTRDLLAIAKFSFSSL